MSVSIPAHMRLTGDEDAAVTLVCDHSNCAAPTGPYGLATHGAWSDRGVPNFDSLAEFIDFINTHANTHNA